MPIKEKIWKAVEMIQSGVAKRIDVSEDIKVYRAGGVVRIDLPPDATKLEVRDGE